MRIRRYNEMFDSEELKAQYEISMLQGNLFSDEIHFTKTESISDLIEKTRYTFPFLDKFNQFANVEKYKNIIFYQQSNQQWYTNISFELEGNGKYGIGILYRHIDNPRSPLKLSLSFSGKDYTYFKEWNNKSFNEIIKIVNTYYIPLLNRLGFEEEMLYKKQISKIRFN